MRGDRDAPAGDRSGTILVDRAWVHQLALRGQPLAPQLKEMLGPYDVVALELGGASALQVALEEQLWLRGKLYPIAGHELKVIGGHDQNAIAAHVEKLQSDGGMTEAIRRYAAQAGRFADDPEKLLSYLYRLICLSAALNADLLLAESRLPAFRALLDYHGIDVERIRTETSDGGRAARSFDFLPAKRGKPSSFAFLTVTNAIAASASGDRSGKADMTPGYVFLSYCRDNADAVRDLRDALVAAGIHVWWDRDIAPGQDWHQEIRSALHGASACVICLSREVEARTKSGIYPEALDAIALYRERKPGSIFLIPVRLSDCPIPPIEIDATRTLNRLQYVDLFPPSAWTENLDRLVTALRTAIADR